MQDSAHWAKSKFLYYEHYQSLVESFDVADSPYPWVCSMLAATYHSDCYHIMGYRDEVPIYEGKFLGHDRKEHKRLSEQSFDHAWSIDSTLAYCAFHRMRLNNYNPAGFRDWFWKGHESATNVLPGMYRSYREYLTPRSKDGDIREVMDFAYAMVDTGRFDTPLPDQFYWNVWHLRSTYGRTDYLQDDKFFEYLKRFCNGYAGAERDAMGEDYWQSAIAIGALFTGNENEGVEIIRKLDKRFDRSARREIMIWEKELEEKLSELDID